MHRSSIFRFLVTLSMISWVVSGHAAPRDRAATAKIDEAINSYYLATEFDRAEAVLIGTLEACEDRCSPQVKARAWMYVGIVRGSGEQDIGGAQQAFQQALALDPRVQLDDALATPAVKEAFAAAAAALGQAPPPRSSPPPAGSSAAVVVSDADVVGDMACTPQVAEVETNRPVPISCTTEEAAAKVSLRYKAFGSEEWTTLALTKRGKQWQGEIPCADTGLVGTLRFFVRAEDRGGDIVDSYGSKKEPVEISLVNQSSAPPPTLPGQPAPTRCMEASSCPDDMIGTPACPGTGTASKQRGTKGWGATCEDSWECDTGLLCTKGDAGRSCETAPSCDADSECPEDSVCMSGVCDVQPEDDPSPTGPFKRHWVGLHGGPDFALMGGTDVCSLESQTSALFSCFYSNDRQYSGQSQKNAAGSINNGFRLGTARVLGSYEFAITPNIGIGARLGFAFNGGPTPAGGSAFLPVHAELRGQYWFGRNALGRKGFRPFVNVGGGVAQVDAKLTVRVADCEGAALPMGADPGADPVLLCRNRLANPTAIRRLDAYKKLGTGFVSLGAGAMYAFEANHGLLLNVNFLYMFSSSGAVLQPTLGYLVGF